jgi:hypothetical protein
LIFIFTAERSIIKFLLLRRTCSLFLRIHFLCELSFDDGKCQIKQEE